jgi:hypothetical protein
VEDVSVSELSVVPSSTDPGAVARWAERLARWAQSGLSASAFCNAERITKSNFFRWKRRLTGTAPRPRAAPPSAAVVPIRLTSEAEPARLGSVELVRPSGTVLRFPADARPELIVAVVRGLEGHPC